MPKPPAPKIIIRTPNWLGDLMMATVFIHAVLEGYPEAQVDLIVKAGFEEIPLPKRGEVFIFDKKYQSAGRLGLQLRKQAYDRFYVLPPSFSSAWMAFLSGAEERIGHRGDFRQWLLKPAVPYTHPARTVHLVQEYLELLDPDCVPKQTQPRLDISSAWVERQLDNLGKPLPEKFVTLATGAIYGPAKQWPVVHYRKLAELIAAQGVPVVVVGTPADSAEGESIARDLNRVVNWCGMTTLPELIAVLAKASLLISNDSGAMHLMTALQRPQIAIFGSTSPTWTGPLNPEAQVLYQALNCSPCFQRTCPLGHYDCLGQITPEAVFAKVQPWLDPSVF